MSQLFAPFRAIGVVCDDVPAAVQQRGTETFVAVAIGRSFQLFGCARLNLLFAGPMLRHRIRALAMHGDLTFAASGSDVLAFRRGRQVAVYNAVGRVALLMVLGNHVLSIRRSGHVDVWDTAKGELWRSFRLSAAVSEPTACCHPPTYLNKVLIGGSTGVMELWNVRTQTCVYSFHGWGSAITVVQPSPAVRFRRRCGNQVDVVAAGLADGRIVLHNVLADETLCTFQHDCSVRSLAFRSDGVAWLLSGDAAGCVAAWDLDRRRIHTMNQTAHAMAVTSLSCLANQPILLSGSSDNSLKMWIFDGAEGGSPRLLRERSGHSAPPTRVRYYDEGQGKHLVSAGLDRAVRATNITVDRQAREMSQRSVSKKRKFAYGLKDNQRLTPVRAVAVSRATHNRWASVLTCHVGDNCAYTWHYQNKVIGEHQCPSSDNSPIMSVEISVCGNFGFVGSARGRLDKYNLQSGIHRGTFAQQHSAAVHGLATDQVNKLVISGSYDGTVKLWDFESRRLKKTVEIGSPVVLVQLQRDNGLLAIASDDLVLRIYDVDCPGTTLVRQFSGHTNRISDICFSSDGRWLLSAGLDSHVRVWDIPQGRCVDWFAVKKPVTSMSLSPTLNFLATTHVDQPLVADMPSPAGTNKATEEWREELVNGHGELQMTALEQLSPELLTLSSVPQSQWTLLSKLDVVKERNKPKAAPKKPHQVPFFLAQSWDPHKIANGPKFIPTRPQEDLAVGSRELNADTIQSSETLLCGLLREYTDADDAYNSVFSALKEMTPSKVDYELRSLGDDVSGDSILRMLKCLRGALQARRDFEVAQAFIHTTLRLHSLQIADSSQLRAEAKLLADVQESTWRDLQSSFQEASSLLNFFSGA